MEIKQFNLIACALTRRNVLIVTALCVSAAFFNILFSGLIMNLLKLPLFLDTVFTAAIAFAFGIIPGIFTAFLSWFFPSAFYNGYSFYILCMIAEVFLICAVKTPVVNIPDSSQRDWTASSKEKTTATYTALITKLFLLYALCAVTISVLGGVIDYFSHLYVERHYFGVDDIFKPGLITYNLPLLAVNIISRIPINIVDRFIVIFAGFFISRGLIKLISR